MADSRRSARRRSRGGPRIRRVGLAAALTLSLLSGAGASEAIAAGPHAAAQTAPVLAYGGDFPDPHVLRVGGVYYAYSTNVAGVNVPVMSSTDLVSWTATAEALPPLPGWASPGRTWAPTVLARGGIYVLYYTVTQTATGRQCISVATAASPAGPFSDTSSGPLVCQLDRGGSIDPYVFTDSGGSSYLLWKSDDNALGRRTSLWARALAAGGAGFAWFSSPVRLLTQTAAWQAPLIEGPAMVRSGNTYYLFYGANNWESSTSAIGYATCSRPLGPCVDRNTAGPWLATDPTGTGPIGPQGPTVFTDTAGRLRLGFAAWNGPVGYANGGVRALWTAPLSFVNGNPTLN
ncbi:MAG: glycoside hydrolase family 43 protein [Actinobacteria bacterium]|nr:glycoside hydrolase family 43 protein [Actinomycetota bacterium]